MKKIEDWIGYVLIGLLVLGLAEKASIYFGVLDYKWVNSWPIHADMTFATTGMILSFLATAVFPIWDVGEHLHTHDHHHIDEETRHHKMLYAYTSIGYVILMFFSVVGIVQFFIFIIAALIAYSVIYSRFIKIPDKDDHGHGDGHH